MIKSRYRPFKLLILALAALVLSACEDVCVEPYEFDSETIIVNSYPYAEGVFGDYDNLVGGQIANATKTGLRINGEEMIIKISGRWSAWSEIDSNDELAEAEICNFCFKKNGVANCICGPDEVPTREPINFDKIPNPDPIDCNNIINQDDPELCTCTKQHGFTSDLDNYMIATNYQRKDEVDLDPDEQEVCVHSRAAGLYLGLFGRDGVTYPLRMYHLYTTNEVCDIPRDTNGRCIDSFGNDITGYIYTSGYGVCEVERNVDGKCLDSSGDDITIYPSLNNKAFMKDDKSGNNGSDIVYGDDEYHEAGEIIKLIINDRYYQDNYGKYKVTFLSGMLRERGDGILEYIVGTVEDFVMGKTGADGRREGGSLNFLYNSLVQDSAFILIIQAILLLYITFLGAGILMGTVEVSRKEVSNRIMKIALVVFFTTSTSWYWYNEIVVGFFKDGMDAIIGIFMNFIDTNVDDTSLVKISQIDRSSDASQSSRFSYIDYVIAKLLSAPVHKKIWGLFLGSIFGFLYIPCIYALIGFFIYTVLTAALVYVTSLIKLVVALGLGPLFILSSLFTKTESAFKQWLSFLAARSLEMIVLFLILYLFLVIIDKQFTDLLWIKVCRQNIPLGMFSFNVMMLEQGSDGANRTLVDWMTSILGLAAIIFLLKTLVDKIPNLISQMVSISGTQAATNNNASSLANAAMGSVLSAAKVAVSQGALPTLRGLNSAGNTLARATGVTAKWQGLKSKIPFRNPLSIARDMKIDSVIKQSRADGVKKGLAGADLAQHIRKDAVKKLGKEGMRDKNQFALLGVDSAAITNRLNRSLVEKPLKNFLKSESKRLKNNTNLYGKDLREKLKENAEKWADKNLHVGKEGIREPLNNLKNFMNKKSELTSSQAAKKFAGDSKAQNAYLDHLNKVKAQKQHKKEDSILYKAKTKAKDTLKSTRVGGAINKLDTKARNAMNAAGRSVYSTVKGKEYAGTKNAKFLEKTAQQERKKHYKDAEKKIISNKKGGEWLNAKASSLAGKNIAKDSLTQKFERTDMDKFRQKSEDERNSQRRADSREGGELNAKMAGRISAINKDYRDKLKKYGYIGDSVGVVGDAPSKVELRKEAKDKLESLASRMTLTDTSDGKKGIESSILSKDDLLTKLKKNNDNIKERKQKMRELSKQIKDEIKETEKGIKVARYLLEKNLRLDIGAEEKAENRAKFQSKKEEINLQKKALNKLKKEKKKASLANKETKEVNEKMQKSLMETQKVDLAANQAEMEVMKDHLENAIEELNSGAVEKGVDTVAIALGRSEEVEDAFITKDKVEEGVAVIEDEDDTAIDEPKATSDDLDDEDNDKKGGLSKEEKAKNKVSVNKRIGEAQSELSAKMTQLASLKGVDNPTAQDINDINVLEGQISVINTRISRLKGESDSINEN